MGCAFGESVGWSPGLAVSEPLHSHAENAAYGMKLYGKGRGLSVLWGNPSPCIPSCWRFHPCLLLGLLGCGERCD
ncbi:MAG: hypothetical protein RL215_2394 [Planctomycetota bacterium]